MNSFSILNSEMSAKDGLMMKTKIFDVKFISKFHPGQTHREPWNKKREKSRSWCFFFLYKVGFLLDAWLSEHEVQKLDVTCYNKRNCLSAKLDFCTKIWVSFFETFLQSNYNWKETFIIYTVKAWTTEQSVQFSFFNLSGPSTISVQCRNDWGAGLWCEYGMS